MAKSVEGERVLVVRFLNDSMVPRVECSFGVATIDHGETTVVGGPEEWRGFGSTGYIHYDTNLTPRLGAIGFEVGHRLDLERAETSVKMLRKIRKALDKMLGDEGHSPSIGTDITRLARAIDAKVLVDLNSVHHVLGTKDVSGYRYRWYGVGLYCDAILTIDHKVSEFRAVERQHAGIA